MEVAALVPGAVANQAPRIDAGEDLYVMLPQKADLRGSYADDGHPSRRATARWTAWRQVSGPGRALFENRFALKTTVEFCAPGTCVLELQGSDGAHLARDSIMVTVRGEPAPLNGRESRRP